MGNDLLQAKLVPLNTFLSEKPRNGLYKGKEFQTTKGNRWVKMSELYSLDFFKNEQTVERLQVTDIEIEKFSCIEGDLLFGRTSLTLEGVGNCLLVQKVFDKPIFESNLFRLRFNKKIASPLFFYYFFKSINGREIIQRIAKQTAATSITASDLIQELVPNLPLNSQIYIANKLYAFDKKITLNRQINHTLEQMSQALFKSWFVDFDPVVDNALDAGFFEQDLAFPDELLRRAEARREVREHGDFKQLPDAIRQLFPAAFEECVEPSVGLGGWVPEGWTVKCVSEAITINPKVNLAKNKIAKFVDMKALPTQGYSIEDVIEKPFSGGMKFQNNDVLVARITPCLQNGKTGIVDFLSDNESGFGSTEFIVIRGNEKVHHTYIACLARYENFRQHVMQSMVGSSGRQRVQNGCFDDYQLAIPSIEIMNKFSSLVSPSFKKLKQNTNESIALANLRDILLPKLISGELHPDNIATDLAKEGMA